MNRGVLYRYNHDTDSDDAQLVIPQHEKQQILTAYHNDPTAGHYGMERTQARIAKSFFWPTMRRDIRAYVAKCVSSASATNSKI